MPAWQWCLFVWVLFTLICGWVAHSKDRSVGLWLFLGFLFGAFALAVIALLPDREKFDYIKPGKPFVPTEEPTRPQTYGKCPTCGRIAFTADADGDYYCYACGETVQVASPAR
jgi:hypothetical protein